MIKCIAPLTPREQEVYNLLVECKNAKENKQEINNIIINNKNTYCSYIGENTHKFSKRVDI